jgi:hypothetical protein
VSAAVELPRESIWRPTALKLCCALLLITSLGAGLVRADGVQEIASAFVESDWRFQRSVSNAPLLPLPVGRRDDLYVP